MAFDQQKFQDTLTKVDEAGGAGREMVLDNLKGQFEGMTQDERKEALQQLMKHNESSSTKISLIEDHSGHVKKVEADETAMVKKALFGEHTESQ